MIYKITKINDRDDLAKSAIETMKESFSKQNEAYVGPFWYDPQKQEVYGYVLSLASDVKPYFSTSWKKYVKTGNALHESIWNKEYNRGKDERFKGDYTKKPRGRVFEFQDEGFVVYVGSWINQYPEARFEILDVFNLPRNTKFRIDEHWEIGHGWSQEI